jgi:hypothetical protein
MADGCALQPAAAIARKNLARQSNESAEYRKALLVEEIELNRHIARVAAQRRALPPGGEVKGNYQFLDEASSVQGANPVDFEELFGDKDTLFVYSWMYGPKRARPCPMCTATLAARTATPTIFASGLPWPSSASPHRAAGCFQGRARLEEPAALRRRQWEVQPRLSRHHGRRD